MKFIQWERQRIGELVKLWNQELGEQFPMREELFAQNSFNDENILYDGSLIAVDNDDNVIGFIVAKRWQEQLDVNMSAEIGWIQVILVDQRHRNQGIGSKLLKHAENTLKASGMSQILLGRDPWHYFPGIPEQSKDVVSWFEVRGYENYGKEYDLIASYEDVKTATVPSLEGVDFSILEKKDKGEFLAFLNRCFPGRWEYEAIHYFKKGGTGREFIILKRDNEIRGFSRINDAQSPFIAQNVYWAPLHDVELGGIGPLGIDANERKKGYGLAIVEAAVAHLRNREINNIVIDWTGLVDFYNKLGYDIWKSYLSYKKSL